MMSRQKICLFVLMILLLLLSLSACGSKEEIDGIDSDEGYFSGVLLSLDEEKAIVRLDLEDSAIPPELLERGSEVQFALGDDVVAAHIAPKVGDQVHGSYSMSRPVRQVTDTRTEIQIYGWGLPRYELRGTVCAIEDGWVILTISDSEPIIEQTEEVWLSEEEMRVARGNHGEGPLSPGDYLLVTYVQHASTPFPPQVTVESWNLLT